MQIHANVFDCPVNELYLLHFTDLLWGRFLLATRFADFMKVKDYFK